MHQETRQLSKNVVKCEADEEEQEGRVKGAAAAGGVSTRSWFDCKRKYLDFLFVLKRKKIPVTRKIGTPRGQAGPSRDKKKRKMLPCISQWSTLALIIIIIPLPPPSLPPSLPLPTPSIFFPSLLPRSRFCPPTPPSLRRKLLIRTLPSGGRGLEFCRLSETRLRSVGVRANYRRGG